MPPLLLLLLGVGVAVAASRRRAPSAAPASPGPYERAPVGRISGDLLVRVFGVGADGDYPAPYRYQDARTLAVLTLQAASETAPAFRAHYDELAARLPAIDEAPLPPWRKSYALLLTIVIPAYAANLLWHWSRPPSRVKDDRFNAILAWAAMFFALPETATAAATIEPTVGYSSLLPGFGAYLDPGPVVVGELGAREQRRCLYDVYGWMASWPERELGDRYGDTIRELVAHARARMADLAHVYPLDERRRAFVIEGNLKAVDEVVWLGNARRAQSIAVDFDAGAAWAGLVVQVVAAIVSAVAPAVSPALGAAIATAGNAVQAIARVAASGEITAAQVQALGGAGVALMLEQAAIRLGLDEEVAQVQALVGIMQR